jgi:hypothetical protein
MFDLECRCWCGGVGVVGVVVVVVVVVVVERAHYY